MNLRAWPVLLCCTLVLGDAFAQSEFETTPNFIKAKRTTELESAVKAFNEIAEKNNLGKSEPPLTLDEIRAAALNCLEDYNNKSNDGRDSITKLFQTLKKLSQKSFP